MIYGRTQSITYVHYSIGLIERKLLYHWLIGDWVEVRLAGKTRQPSN
jgi:hypothetical protein